MTWLVDFFSLFACVVLLFSCLGLIKLPDGWTQLASTSKTSTLALFLVTVAASFHPISEGYLLYLWGSYLFFVLSTPVAAHLLGRAALISGEKMAPEAEDLRKASSE